jgi:arylsulfatase
VLLAACGPPPPSDLPNLLVVTLDTTRADHLGTYGYFRETSPVLDDLARNSLVFENAIAPIATTLPSHVSLFTGTAPYEHGVLANETQAGQRFVPAAGLRPISEIAARLGYRTAAFVSAAPLKRDSGIETGFETFDEPAGKRRAGRETADAAIEWLSRVGATPFFLWVHFFDAHWPYEVPPPYDRLYATDARLERRIAERRIPDRALRPLAGIVDDARTSINNYDGALRYQDDELGRLLGWLRERGRFEDTAILLLGDHGEGLCQHGEPAHGGTWAEQLRVPLLMRIPGMPARRIAQPISTVDALPTFLGLVDTRGLELPDGQPSGRDVLANGSDSRPILSQDTGRERGQPYRVALTAGRWKYFRIEEPGGSVRDGLYDLEQDPFELEDVAPQHPERVEGFRQLVEERVREQLARGQVLRGGRPIETRALDPALAEQLEALGYATGEEAR